jgi:hypothetical protein
VVSKPFREKWVGKPLVERAKSEAKHMGVKYLNVEPVARNMEPSDSTMNWASQTQGRYSFSLISRTKNGTKA